jgi:hypothetical protein
MGIYRFLWAQWLIQDFANIYVYLPRSLSGMEITISLTILLAMLGYIFYSRGGAIQAIVKAKTNTVDIRSATIIDFLYALILLFFKEFSKVPMSTTWVFLGLLAGREIAIRYQLGKEAYEPTRVFRILGLLANLLIFGFITYVVGYGVYIKLFEPDIKLAISNVLILSFAAAISIKALLVFIETKKESHPLHATYRMIGMDLGKITFGLIVSILLVILMKWLTTGDVGF